jgi:hypothetical protein
MSRTHHFLTPRKAIRTILSFLFILIFVPSFLVDLVYCEELTAPPLFLISLVDGEVIDASEDHSKEFSIDDSATVCGASGLLNDHSHFEYEASAKSYSQHPPMVSLASRPPPLL